LVQINLPARQIFLTLPLLVARFFTNNAHDTATLDDFAVATNLFH
jgi:hypothetical protein